MNYLESAIRKLATEDLDTRAADVLALDLVDLEVASGLLEAERSRRLRAFNQRRAYVESDHTSSTAFLMHRCRIAPARAKRLVAHSNSLAEMPAALDALSDGLLSIDQVRQLILAHDTNPDIYGDHEAGLVEAIAPLSVTGTARAVDYWRQTVNESRFETDAADLHEQRRLHLSQTFEGMGRIDGWLDPEGFAYVKAALDAATPPPGQDDSRTSANAGPMLSWIWLDSPSTVETCLKAVVRSLTSRFSSISTSSPGTDTAPAKPRTERSSPAARSSAFHLTPR